MQLFDAPVEEVTLYRVVIPNDAVRSALNLMNFEEHNGEMALYQERYADAERILQVIEELDEDEVENDEIREAIEVIKSIAEEIADGTICFYEA